MPQPPQYGGPFGAPVGTPRRTRQGGDLDTRAREALDTGSETAAEFTDEFRNRAFGYDPDEAVRRAAEGAFTFLETDIKEGVESLRGSQVSAGRFNTGFGKEDEDRLVRTIFDRFNAEVARNSLESARLNLANIGQLGDYSNLSTNRYLEFLSAERDRETAAKNARVGIDDLALGAAETAGRLLPVL